MKDIVINHQIAILKDIFKESEKYIKQKERADSLAMKQAENGNSVRTQRHWQAVADGDMKIKEIDRLLEELCTIDLVSNWHNRLMYNQDKLNFIKKYPKTLKCYELKYKTKEKTNEITI